MHKWVNTVLEVWYIIDILPPLPSPNSRIVLEEMGVQNMSSNMWQTYLPFVDNGTVWQVYLPSSTTELKKNYNGFSYKMSLKLE